MHVHKLNEECFDQKPTDSERDAIEELMAKSFVPLPKAVIETPKFGGAAGDTNPIGGATKVASGAQAIIDPEQQQLDGGIP